MRAELANLNHCAVPFFKPRRRQLVLVLLYSKTKTYIIHGFWDQNLVRPGTVDNRGRTIFNNFTLQWRMFLNTVNFPVHFQHFRSWSVYLFRTSFWYVKENTHIIIFLSNNNLINALVNVIEYRLTSLFQLLLPIISITVTCDIICV